MWLIMRSSGLTFISPTQRRSSHRTRIETRVDEKAPQRCRSDWTEMSVAELLLDNMNMRHTQEHAAQLSLFLGQRVGSAPGWVAKARTREE